MCSNYGHHRNPETYHRDYKGQVDFFAVYCPETSGVYLVPIDDLPVKPRSVLTRRPTHATTSDDESASPPNYEIGRVAIEGLRAPSGA